VVIKAVEGFRRKTPKRSDIRVPISLSLLKKLIGSLTYVCKSSYEISNGQSYYIWSKWSSLLFGLFLNYGCLSEGLSNRENWQNWNLQTV
jgi:hypothetical protein